MVFAIRDRFEKINGLIPDISLITVDQISTIFNQPVTFKIDSGIDELAELNNL
jgi:hypothetical protein